ncbi:MAG: cysteine-rich small domain-containing protein [Clostridia bacterium]|nr:cysteine-rich small domain-containing protein [Clostridia bacterium]
MTEKENASGSRFFQNRACEYFPCHKGVPEEEFSCLFCYCPLYALGKKCGGDFVYTEQGIKDCSGCTFPHRKENYDAVLARWGEIAALVKKSDGDP